MILILKNGNETAVKYGFNSAIDTLCKGLDEIGISYTFDESKEFDVIVANDFFNGDKGIQLKTKTGKPLIASLHLSHPDQEEEHRLLKNCDGIITYSNIHKKYIMEHHKIGVPIQVIPLGINTNKWKNLNKNREDFLLFVGRTKADNKNFLPILWNSFMEGVQLKIAGDLDQSSKIGNFTCKYMNASELLEMYNVAQLHILPSLFEPFGLVTLEAMACGCPVVVSDQTGISELLNDKVAIIFNPYKPFSLKKFMEQAKSFDSNELNKFALQYDHINHAKKFVEALKDIVDKKTMLKEITIKQTTDLFIVLEEINRGDYDYFDKDDIFAVKDRDVVDIGAYLGETAVHFSKRGARRVYAVEPFDSFHRISINAKENGCDNVIAIRGALGTKNKTVKIKKVINDGSTKFSDEYEDENGEKVEVMNLKSITEKFNIENGFLKVDCEGAEISLLYCDKDTFRKYDYIIVEVHKDMYEGFDEALSKHLTLAGFNVFLQERTETVSMIYANKIDN